MNTNATLQHVYDEVYSTGAQQFFSVNSFEESQAIYRMGGDWTGKRVLEIGCGEGRLAALIGMGGAAHVYAIDYSSEAIGLARKRFDLPNVAYAVGDASAITGQYDAVVMQGVLEHLEIPWLTLHDACSVVRPGGFVITSSPSFHNPRGYVWMALQVLLGVPMSLTDLHFFTLQDFQQFANHRGYALRYETIHQSWGKGQLLIKDFQKRLTNALRDAGFDNSRVPEFLEILQRLTAYEPDRGHTGATAIYRIDKP